MIRPPCNGGGAMPFRAKNHNSNPLSSTKQAGLAWRRVSFIFTIHAKWTLTSSIKAVLSPPAVSRPWNAIVCTPVATVNAAVM
jgi:RES domain-containing protein